MNKENIKVPSVGVVILNWNGKEDTLSCLESLFKCTYPALNVYLVDNGSVDGTISAVKESFGNKTNLSIIDNGANLGYAGGNNTGMRRAVADNMEYVLLLNNDTEVDPGFIEPLVEALNSNPDVGAVTSKIYFISPNNKIWFFGGAINRNTGLGGPVGGQVIDNGQLNQPVECDYVSGCVLLTRREILQEVGYLDDDYFYLCEDVDFCFRLSDVGYRILAIPESIVWHKVTASLQGGEESPVRLYFRSRNQMLLVSKNKKGFRPFVDRLYLIKYHTFYILRRIAKGKSFKGTFYYLKGLYDYLRGKVGNMK